MVKFGEQVKQRKPILHAPPSQSSIQHHARIIPSKLRLLHCRLGTQPENRAFN